MTPDDVGKGLHDKATRGVPLSAEEQTLLAEWYDRLDSEEGQQLGGPESSPTLAALQAKVDGTLAQLVSLTQRIQSLAAENDTLRREVVALEQRLAQKRATQPA
jgi:hypothetical protein